MLCNYEAPMSGKNLGGARTMEIGPIRNQNLIFCPLANAGNNLTRDNKK